MTRIDKPAQRKLSKEQVERRTFEVLAATLDWKIEHGSIQQPPPDHPDIRCVIVDTGPLAIELVAIDASETRLRLNNMVGTPYAWQLALTWWPEAERSKLQADLRNAHVSVHLGNDAGTRDRAKLLYGLQSFLLVNPGLSGHVEAEDLEYPRGFHGANIGRFDTISNGPQVSSPSGDYLRAPQVGQIVTKLRDKSYDSAGAPMELFAYATHDEPDGAVGWLEAIQSAVAEHLPTSKFRRAHLFHLGFKQHIWSSPPATEA